jgi:hypothetical protein
VLKIYSSDKRKLKTLSAKAEVIKKLDEGKTIFNLAKEHGVGRATVYDTRKNREKMECFVKYTDSGPSDRRALKPGEYPEVEGALYVCFLQEFNRHAAISGEIFEEKAKYLYKIIKKKISSEQAMVD